MGTRTLNRISPAKLSKLQTPGRYCDGGGLLLQVSGNGTRSWIFRFQLQGQKRDMGLGPVGPVSLADARKLAEQCRLLVAKKIDPIVQRNINRQEEALVKASALTFGECALKLISAKAPSWRNEKHEQQWRRSLETYAFPLLATLPVRAINTDLVIKVLEPLWLVKNPTASRLRERIEAVLDAAKARGHRVGENPARWRGHLENLLANPQKIHTIVHHPALPYCEVASFLAEVRVLDTVAAKAMEFLILTSTRASETLNARWDEINFDNAVWSVPASRTKTGKLLRIPLAEEARAVLTSVQKPANEGYIFPGRAEMKPLSKMAFQKLLSRLNRPDITTHGFRSTFRDWAAEHTNFPREVAEMALGHSVGNQVEAAYRRGDLFLKRQKLMSAWATYCSTNSPTPKVIELNARRSI